MEKHFNSYYFFYFKKSETSVEKESTSTIEDNNEEQDTYVLTLSQKVKEENQSDQLKRGEREKRGVSIGREWRGGWRISSPETRRQLILAGSGRIFRV